MLTGRCQQEVLSPQKLERKNQEKNQLRLQRIFPRAIFGLCQEATEDLFEEENTLIPIKNSLFSLSKISKFTENLSLSRRLNGIPLSLSRRLNGILRI